MDTASIQGTLTLVNGAIDAAKKAVGMARELNNIELKQQVSEVFDAVLDLKVRVSELQEENSGLRNKLELKESLHFDPKSGFFFKDGDENPICPKCYQSKDHLLVYLQNRPKDDYQSACRPCPNCGTINYVRS